MNDNIAPEETAPVAPPQGQQASNPSTALTTISGVQRTSFGDANAAKTDNIPTYKGKKGITERIAVISAANLIVGRSHFSDVQGVGYVLCRSTFKRSGDVEVPESIAQCCQMLPEARKRCTTFIIKYATDKNGKPTQPLEFNMMAWVFGPEKFEKLHAIHTEHGLENVDLLVTCEDEQFQKLTFVPTSRERCYRALPAFKQRYDQTIADWVRAMQGKLERNIGREVSDADLIKKLGTGAGAASASSVAPMTAAPEIAALFPDLPAAA